MQNRRTTSLLPHCRSCGEKCCRYSTPILDQGERDRIVAATGKDFFAEVQTPAGNYYIIGRKADGSLRAISPDEDMEGEPCSFLAPDGTCSIHDIKPLDCAAYPLRAVPQPHGLLYWHLHRTCPAHNLLSSEFLAQARRLAHASAQRFAPEVYNDWLQRFSRWTLEPGAAYAWTDSKSLDAGPTDTTSQGGSGEEKLGVDPVLPGDANEFMGATMRKLAALAPHLRDRSGRGFWPTPAMFPLLLAHCLHRLQERVSDLYLNGRNRDSELLAACRNNLLRLVAEGDLGEDHTALFLGDHSGISALGHEEYRQLPFFSFCQEVLRIQEPIVLLGVLMRNEAGSIGEMEALLAENLIAPGRFSEVHLVEEVIHARLAQEIAERLTEIEEFRDLFYAGQSIHDELYAAVVPSGL